MQISLFLHKTNGVNLLFVNFSIPWGGGEFWHLQHASELSIRGYNVSMLTNYRSHLSRKLQTANIRHYTIRVTNRSFINPLKYLQITRIIQREKPDCVVLNGSNELKIAGVSARLMGVRKIIYRRGNAEQIKPHKLNRMLMRNTTHLVANSSFIMNQLRRDFQNDLPPCQDIIPNGIRLKPNPPSADYTKARIAVLGRLSWEKGVDMAIQAFNRIREKVPHAQLVIIGEGEERTNLHKLCEKLGMNGEVEFTGFLDTYDEVLASCSLLMIPSRWEGFSFAKLEAMSQRIPVVAFELDSLKENICSEDQICFVKPYDTNDLAEKSLSLITKPDKLKKMGECGYQHASQFYNLDETLTKFEKILHS